MALFHTHFFFFFFFPSIMITTRSFALHYLFSLFAVECVEFLWVQVTSFLFTDFFLKCFLSSFLASKSKLPLSGDTKNTQQVLTNNNNYYYQTYNNIKRGKKDKEKVNNE